MKKVNFWFDMDGTIADLYGVDGWLSYLRNEDTFPYRAAAPIGDVDRLVNALAALKANGYKVGVISWTSKTGSPAYNKRVRSAKVRWLNKYFPGLFDEIHIVKYGTPKTIYGDGGDILFDDNDKIRADWDYLGQSYTPDKIIELLEQW